MYLSNVEYLLQRYTLGVYLFRALLLGYQIPADKRLVFMLLALVGLLLLSIMGVHKVRYINMKNGKMYVNGRSEIPDEGAIIKYGKHFYRVSRMFMIQTVSKPGITVKRTTVRNREWKFLVSAVIAVGMVFVPKYGIILSFIATVPFTKFRSNLINPSKIVIAERHSLIVNGISIPLTNVRNYGDKLQIRGSEIISSFEIELNKKEAEKIFRRSCK